MKKKTKGFTLVELIAVIAVLAIIAVIVIPNVLGYIKSTEQAKIKNEATIMVQIAYRQQAEGGIDLSNKSSPVRLYDLLQLYDNEKYIGYSVSSPEAAWNDLGVMTMLQQLIEISNMPVKDIPIKNGKLPQVNGQAVLN